MDRQFLFTFTFFNSLTTNEAAPLMNRTSLNELHQACLYPQTWERLFLLPILIPLHIAWRFFFFFFLIGFSIPCTSDQLFDFFFCMMERRRVKKKSCGGVGSVKLYHGSYPVLLDLRHALEMKLGAVPAWEEVAFNLLNCTIL